MKQVLLANERRDEGLSLGVLILYDERESGFRAKELFDRITALSSGVLRYDLELFRFDVLEDRSLGEAALARAAASDLLVVAFRHDRAMPEGVASWLEDWAASPARDDRAVVALPDEPWSGAPAAGSVDEALRSCACHHGLTFLSEWSMDTALAWSTYAVNLQKRAHALTPTLLALLDPMHLDVGTRGGLNE